MKEEAIYRDTVFLFNGVGINFRKYPHYLLENSFGHLSQYNVILKERFNFDILGYIFSMKSHGWDSSLLNWITIFTLDNIAYKMTYEMINKPYAYMGYSMGLITAMVCSGSLSYESGIELLIKIFEYPINAGRKDETMATIIGFSLDDIKQLIKNGNYTQPVEIASENNAYCFTLSGRVPDIEKLICSAIDNGALYAKILDVPYAFHSSYAKKGIDSLTSFVESIKMAAPKIAILSCYSLKFLREPDELREELIKNMYTPMKWDSAIQVLIKEGAYSFIEISFGDYLTRFSRMINQQYHFFTHKEISCFKERVF